MGLGCVGSPLAVKFGKQRPVVGFAGSGVNCERFAPPAHAATAPTALSDAEPQHLRVLLPAWLLWDKGLGEWVGAARKLGTQGLAIDGFLTGMPDA